ncbi:unnamed protein product [Rotaria socialis]|uniref:F-box domain-containing protein n=3 Tax=Rotaria socialis TaxID=392032 RepID=A0A820JIZ7_9BILA|nr:unnamed protein product [Rotaria socialis]CAF3305903.1 unnamed protein product [Rotaria socialis]CAF3328982.1 unnamed protein product [Rotaria socialis]CAF3718077.1 unnamed protein product [Rotaria socialis]CAF4237998.1 unnamed protein product [Rotaria socialis]
MMLASAGLYILRNQLRNLLNLTDTIEDLPVNNDQNSTENLLKAINTIKEQTPIAIRNFSSQYGSNGSDSYVVSNVCSNPEIYPLYGDSTHALVFRTYGPWWINLPSYQETKNFTRWENHFTSRDFIDIEFRDFVYECYSLNIYETYNPGTLEVVYVGKEDHYGNIIWHRIWSFPQPFSIVLSNSEEIIIENGLQSTNDLFPDHIKTDSSVLQTLNLNAYTRHTCPPAARLPRIVKISLKDKISFPTRLIRLEFDHSTVSYYSEIDTVILSGKILPTDSVLNESNEQREPSLTTIIDEQNKESNSSMDLSKLPFDILFIICSYLDLRSLIRLSSTCQTLHNQCLHPLQFQSLNLQPYWNGITNFTIENFFLRHCTRTRYISLAWSKSLQCSSFNQLLNVCSNGLVQLNLACCQYLNGLYIKIIVNCCPNIEILNLENCISLNNLDFIPLKYLDRVRSLNVYRTKIDYRTLLPFIDNNKKNLEHINLGSCQKLSDTIGMIRLLFSRCTNLRSVDLWRTYGLTQNGFFSLVGSHFDTGEEKRRILNLSRDEQEELAILYSSVNMPIGINSLINMKYLREIDLGWTDPPSGFIRSFVQQVGHSLIKLFLTACRRVNNEDIMAVSEHCLQLRQLDLLGSSIIIESTVECVLKRCLYLEFLDLSFCDKISNETVSIWMCQYKNCFKRSYSPRMNDDIYTEFD